MSETPSLLERFLRSDATMYAGPGESMREYVDKMLLAASEFSGVGEDQVPAEAGDRVEVSP